MNTLDALLASGQALIANHTAVDHTINAGLLYGPGVLATAAAVTAWRTTRWAVARCNQWKTDRADRRYYTAVAARLNTVADNTDRLIAQAGDRLAEQLLQQIYANDTEGEK
ncbi:hypothetical protein OG384_04605 [Streptomyces sp. NBC_01324]|uniref:hypothetical protein n=1 Tax=Streptomyces sp. NBC_01324 TaxID=2903826 RepID=UPI002E127EA7|nr:hypothetical protein OG384_04605 [Streptomyces sp. NBC_01324]